MRNRIITLFDLDELLGAARARPREAAKKSPAVTLKPAGAKPAPREVKAHAFDLGDPISLQYGDAHVRSVSRPAPPAPVAGKVRARGQSYFVESFDDADPDAPPAAEAEEAEKTPEDELAELGIARDPDSALLAETEEEPETKAEDSAAQSHRAPPPRRRPLPAGPSHAEQVAAFEREVQALAAQRPPESPVPAVPIEDTSVRDEDSTRPPPVKEGGHRVFDQMAEGMAYASEFRLPPVEVTKLFRELDEQLDTQAHRAPAQTRAGDPEPLTHPATVAPALNLPDDEVLAGDLAQLNAPPVDPDHVAHVLAEQLGTGKLLHFEPEELVLSDDETLAVFAFFWPEMDLNSLGQITDQDRGFAQALLIEAADASHSMGMVETVFRYLFTKVPRSFASIRSALLKVARKAIEDQWFKKIKTVAEAEKVEIYESVRVTVQRNFRTVLALRRSTGELTGY